MFSHPLVADPRWYTACRMTQVSHTDPEIDRHEGHTVFYPCTVQRGDGRKGWEAKTCTLGRLGPGAGIHSTIAIYLLSTHSGIY